MRIRIRAISMAIGVMVLAGNISLSAQGILKGNVRDSVSKQPLGLATISIYKASDTILISYRLSTPDGNFRVPNIPLHLQCRAVISYSGYAVYRKDFQFNDNQSSIDFGNILLNRSTKSLDEILVVAERPPIIVRRDTIEFNVSSFKTLPNSLVEDLLKKLPGVDVDKDGSIYVNGKTVNRILVDGKAFFGNDLRMATRNLPANIIDKVQVADDREEIDRNITGDLTNIGKVINLKLKKGVKKGLFGKAYAGLGNKQRYEAGAIANMFRDTLQLSVLAFTNNVSRSGFSMKEVQDLGGFNRSGYQSLNVGKRGGNQGFNLNGISFGGLDAGIAKNGGIGFNMNHAPSAKYNFYVQYLLGLTSNNIDEINNTEQFIKDTLINSRLTSFNKRSYLTHSANIGTAIKPNPFKDIIIKAGFVNSRLENNLMNEMVNTSNVNGLLNTARGTQENTTISSVYFHNFSLSKRYKSRPGRVMNISHSVNWKRNTYDATNESKNYYFYPGQDSILFQLYRNQLTPAISVNGALSFTEPLSKKVIFRWNNSFDYIRESQHVQSYNKDAASGKYTVLLADQSNLLRRYQDRLSSIASFTIKIKKSTLSLGLNNLIQETVQKNPDKSVYRRFRYDPLPTLSFIKDQLSIRFNQEIVLPAFNYLQTIPDQANLVYIRKGNIDLVPARRSNFSINYFKYDIKTRTAFSIGGFGTGTKNDIILARTVNATGIQEIIPENISHSYYVSSNLGYSREIRKSKDLAFTFSTITFINFESKEAILNLRSSTQTLWQFVPRVTVRLNWKDLFEMRNEYSLNLENVTYSTNDFKDLRNATNNFENEIIVRWPEKLVFESNLFYRRNGQVAPGLPADNLLWNVGINYLFLKGNKGQLRLSVYDVLNRNNSFSRFLTQNYITDIQTNILKRYALLTFTYNFNNLGSNKKIGGKESLFLF